MEDLYAQFEEKGTTSWVETDNYFKRHIHKSVKIKTYASWNEVDAVIEARNAVVHGLGRFTARQIRRGVPKRTESHLRRLKFAIPTDCSRVLVTRDALEETATLLRGYPEWLDHLLAAIP